MPRAPLVALLTDFGLADGYVGVMKGVMLGIVPDLPLVDLTHEVPPQDILTGAWVLHTSWRYLPTGSVALCVVDPGVGGARRAVALKAADHFFVGPDNGLFSFVLASAPVESAVVLDNPRYHLPTPSATFHGRDIFAPCAAHLAAGLPINALGSPIASDSLIRLPALAPEWQGDTLVAAILHIDHFGNLITSIPPALTDAILATSSASAHLGDQTITARAATFAAGPLDAPFLLRDSSGHLAIVIRNGNAARTLALASGAPIHVEGLPKPTDQPPPSPTS